MVADFGSAVYAPLQLHYSDHHNDKNRNFLASNLKQTVIMSPDTHM